MAASLSGIFVYPIKSCAGIAVDAWPLDACGLRHDRRFMLVRPDGGFVTQRELPTLARVEVGFAGEALRVAFGGRDPLSLPLLPVGEGTIEVTVWNDRVRALRVGAFADRWFSDALGLPLVVANIPDEVVRPVDPRYAAGARTGFADGFPLLVVGQASLDDLNSRLSSPVPMDRFRPNLVVAGSPAFAEDDWRELHVGAVPIRIVKPCARCVITTTDQATGMRGAEPLRTLATFRRVGNEVMFGQNAIHLAEGELRVGDRVSENDRRGEAA